MKKLITLLAIFTITSSVAFAADNERPRARALDRELTKITEILENADAEISERRRAYLEQRQELLGFQVEVRDAVREAISELGEDATDEARREAVQEVRATFADQFQEIKEARRDAVRERRSNRRAEAEEE